MKTTLLRTQEGLAGACRAGDAGSGGLWCGSAGGGGGSGRAASVKSVLKRKQRCQLSVRHMPRIAAAPADQGEGSCYPMPPMPAPLPRQPSTTSNRTLVGSSQNDPVRLFPALKMWPGKMLIPAVDGAEGDLWTQFISCPFACHC